MQRTLSHPATFIFKFLFPLLWIPGFGAGALALWLHPQTTTFNGVPGAGTPKDQWTFLLAWIIGSVTVLIFLTPLKRVVLRRSELEISNYRRTITVPLSQVADVTQAVWFAGRVTIEFTEPTPFGYTATFLPSTRRRFAFWKEDDFVTELRSLAEQARTQRYAGAA
jgi:hypothetical protein